MTADVLGGALVAATIDETEDISIIIVGTRKNIEKVLVSENIMVVDSSERERVQVW